MQVGQNVIIKKFGSYYLSVGKVVGKGAEGAILVQPEASSFILPFKKYELLEV